MCDFFGGNVLPHGGDVVAPALADGVRRHADVGEAVILVPVAVLELCAAFGQNAVNPCAELFRRHAALNISNRHAEHFLARVAELLAGGGIDADKTKGFGVEYFDRVGRFFNQRVHQRQPVVLVGNTAAALDGATQARSNGFEQGAFFVEKGGAGAGFGGQWCEVGDADLRRFTVHAFEGGAQRFTVCLAAAAEARAIMLNRAGGDLREAHCCRQARCYGCEHVAHAQIVVLGDAGYVVQAGQLLDPFAKVILRCLAGNQRRAEGEHGTRQLMHCAARLTADFFQLGESGRVDVVVGQRLQCF